MRAGTSALAAGRRHSVGRRWDGTVVVHPGDGPGTGCRRPAGVDRFRARVRRALQRRPGPHRAGQGLSICLRRRPGLRPAGGLELATSDEGAEEAERRAGAARAAGLPARMLRAGALPGPVARFVDAGQVTAAACFPEDGVAVPAVLTAVLREQAEGNGARFLPGQDVTGIGHEAGAVVVTTASGGRFAADDVVLAGGVWGPSLAGLTGLDLPLFPVAHPYAYSAADPRLSPGHFVRWQRAMSIPRPTRGGLTRSGFDRTAPCWQRAPGRESRFRSQSLISGTGNPDGPGATSRGTEHRVVQAGGSRPGKYDIPDIKFVIINVKVGRIGQNRCHPRASCAISRLILAPFLCCSFTFAHVYPRAGDVTWVLWEPMLPT